MTTPPDSGLQNPAALAGSLSSRPATRALVETAGFAVLHEELHATQGTPIERALANRISVSVGLIAKPA